MLVLLSLTICGPHYTYDNPSVLQSQIQKEYRLDSTYYSYLYSIYAAPNIFLPFFGGILIQRWGKGNVIILTTFLTFVG
jgi:MFS family permease